jgi:hypothetical protein
MKHLYLFAFLILSGCGTLNFFGAPTATVQKQEEIDVNGKKLDNCPNIDVRDGAAVHKLTNGRGDGPLDIRYQMTITDVARECWQQGNTFKIRFGIEGRVVVGPLGGAGTLALPLRVAMFKGINEPVWSKFYKVNVAIPSNAPSVPFVVTEEVTMTAPSYQEFIDYDIFVGFDPKGELAKESRPVKKKK